ncbi:MAG TPA: ABC transporter substrate-binding protein [Sporichthya sp.]|nr:ABC transporter substrate-binding protein [Sporichthya sp.]
MATTRWSLLLAAALVVTGCGGGSEDNSPAAGASKTPEAAGQIVYHYGIDDTAKGPAAPVPGAVSGGTVRVYNVVDFGHLDPARIYSNYEQATSLLLTRTLTSYKQSGSEVSLVGDLATNTGVTKDGGKTWTYTLRDGVTWEDGSPITSADVRYGIERTFFKDYVEGPTYIQSWFADSQNFRKYYPGPYDGKHLDAITTPDAKTIVLKFPKPQPDVPFALAMPAGAAVKESKDTRAKYDLDPFSSGPYMVEAHKVDKSMTVVRNPNWKPETDPIRNAYVDRFEFSFGELPLATNQRLIAANGDDQAGMTSVDLVSPEVLQQVVSTPDLLNRTISGVTAFTTYEAINTKRITDLRVRKALMYAFPRQQIRQLLGGPTNGDFATTIGSPTLVGHEDSDVFKVPPAGDPEKAKALLTEAGKMGQKIVYAYGNLPRGEQVAVLVIAGLEKAGFQVIKKPVDPKLFSENVSDPNNSYDLYGGGWGADWPSGTTVYPPLFDGRKIGKGSFNTSFLNDPALNKEMDEISLIADPAEAGKRWAALDRKIMEQVPVIPNLYDKNQQLFGPKIGGALQDIVLGIISLNGIFVKP